MNEQEIFTTVKNHLLEQNAKSVKLVDGEAECMYRGENGCKCAVGCLMPDDMYDPECEGKNTLEIKVQECLPIFREEPIANDHDDYRVVFLNELQDIHDTCEVEEWPIELEKFADKHSLEY